MNFHIVKILHSPLMHGLKKKLIAYMCMPISGETWTQHTVWLYVRLMRDILLVSLFRFFSTWCLQGKFFDKHVQANALNMDEN